MLGFIDQIWLLISAIIAITILGVIAGFSPTLYVTQIGVSTRSKRTLELMVAMMLGVLLGIIALSIVFQFLQLEILLKIIDSTFNAIIVSVFFNIIIGTIFIVAGFWYINKKPNRISDDRPPAKASYWALVSLGFVRTFASISGATATFFASGIITDSRVGIVSHLLLTAIFLAATVAPFGLLLVMINKQPKRVKNLLSWLKEKLIQYNYKLVIGAGSIFIGSGIVIFNLLKAVLY